LAVCCVVAPEIGREGINTTPRVTVNATTVLNCPVSGIPSPQISWLRDSLPIDPSLHRNLHLVADGRQLRIESAAVTDAVRYRCLATNKAGRDQLDYQLAVHSQSTALTYL